jgi:hypothetical protein
MKLFPLSKMSKYVSEIKKMQACDLKNKVIMKMSVLILL